MILKWRGSRNATMTATIFEDNGLGRSFSAPGTTKAPRVVSKFGGDKTTRTVVFLLSVTLYSSNNRARPKKRKSDGLFNNYLCMIRSMYIVYMYSTGCEAEDEYYTEGRVAVIVANV